MIYEKPVESYEDEAGAGRDTGEKNSECDTDIRGVRVRTDDHGVYSRFSRANDP